MTASRWLQIRRWSLPTWCLLGVALVLWAGQLENPYLTHVRGMPPPHPYPWRGVLFLVGYMGVLCAMLSAILRPESYHRSWGRALSAFMVAGFFTGLGMLGAMHAPPYFSIGLQWLLSVWLVTLLTLLWSVGSTVRHVWRHR